MVLLKDLWIKSRLENYVRNALVGDLSINVKQKNLSVEYVVLFV